MHVQSQMYQIFECFKLNFVYKNASDRKQITFCNSSISHTCSESMYTSTFVSLTGLRPATRPRLTKA